MNRREPMKPFERLGGEQTESLMNESVGLGFGVYPGIDESGSEDGTKSGKGIFVFVSHDLLNVLPKCRDTRAAHLVLQLHHQAQPNERP